MTCPPEPPASTAAERLALWAYQGLMCALVPLLPLRLAWRGWREPGYRLHWRQRLGLGLKAQAPGALWVHAVSLGETRAAASLIDELRVVWRGRPLLLTHGTATGREAGAALLQDGDRQRWLPHDCPQAVRRFLRAERPAIGILMETEVWPSLMAEAQARGLPLVLANARLSERSARRGEQLRALMAPAARRLRLALAQTEHDARRLRAQGVPEVQVAGNLKYDMTPDPALLARGRAWRHVLAEGGAAGVVLAASTRDGEEAELLAAWAAARQSGQVQGQRLLLVPRHPQRFEAVAQAVQRMGWAVARRSQAWQAEGLAEAQDVVALGDSLGEMPAYYAAADVALLGGSFQPLGGQNLIEAAACGCPLVMGPSTFNFAQAAELALAAGAARRATDAHQGLQLALAWLAAPAEREAAQVAGLALTAAHRGAAARMAAAIAGLA